MPFQYNIIKMKTKWFIFSLMIMSIIVFSLQSCGDKGKNSKDEDQPEEITDFSNGEKMYKSKCVVCHQADGKGIQGAFPGLIGKQADLKTVVNGREGTIMKAFKHELTDPEIVEVVNYINHTWGNNFSFTRLDSVSALK
jgi:mono/diheme cytochrome c family protein